MIIRISMLLMAFKSVYLLITGNHDKGLDKCVITTNCLLCQGSEHVRLSGSTVTALPDGVSVHSGYFSTSLKRLCVDADHRLMRIKSCSFDYCSVLTSVIVDNASSMNFIGHFAIHQCSSLALFTLTNECEYRTE